MIVVSCIACEKPFWCVQEAQSAERAALQARRAADERAASAAEQETRIAAAQTELSAARQRLQQQQSQLAVRWALSAACARIQWWSTGY
jgi:hypothetical protein